MRVSSIVRALGSVMFLSLAPVAAWAQGAPAPAAAPTSQISPKSSGAPVLKVALVDMQAAILQTNEGIQARNSIQKEAEKKRQTLMNQQKTLQANEESIMAQQAVLDEATKAKKIDEFRKQVEAFRADQYKLEQEMRQKEMEATHQITMKLSDIISEISKKMALDVVFEKSANSVLYAKEAVDITAKVVEEYNKRHKSPPASETKKPKAKK